MKQYKNLNELVEYLISKGVSVSNQDDTLYKIEKYSYYSVINSYKMIFKDKNNNYIKNVSFDEIYALYEFDKNYKSKDNTTNLYMLINVLKLVLSKSNYEEMTSNINLEIKKLDSKLKSIGISNILKVMGYPNV